MVGCDEQGANEALFLRRYSRDITLVPRAFGELDAEQRDERARAGITTIEHAVDRFELHGNSMHVYLQERPDPMEFDVI